MRFKQAIEMPLQTEGGEDVQPVGTEHVDVHVVPPVHVKQALLHTVAQHTLDATLPPQKPDKQSASSVPYVHSWLLLRKHAPLAPHDMPAPHDVKPSVKHVSVNVLCSDAEAPTVQPRLHSGLAHAGAPVGALVAVVQNARSVAMHKLVLVQRAGKF